jgi:hypothetical protein
MYTRPGHPSIHEIYFILVKINGLKTSMPLTAGDETVTATRWSYELPYNL